MVADTKETIRKKNYHVSHEFNINAYAQNSCKHFCYYELHTCNSEQWGYVDYRLAKPMEEICRLPYIYIHLWKINVKQHSVAKKQSGENLITAIISKASVPHPYLENRNPAKYLTQVHAENEHSNEPLRKKETHGKLLLRPMSAQLIQIDYKLR